MLVIVIAGPIASGKSALSREVARQFEETIGRIRGGVIDLDLIYEMLDPQRGPKADPETWTLARQTAGWVASRLLAAGRFVVVEGNVASEPALREFETELTDRVVVRLVMLEVSFEIARKRAASDSGRGISTDPAFLAAHYEHFRADEFNGRNPLRLDTSHLTVTEAARAVVDWHNRSATSQTRQPLA